MHNFKNSTIGVFLHALQVYLRPQAWFRMSFLTYLTKIIFSLKSIIPFLEMISKDDFFNLLYAKSKMTFKTYSWPLSKLVVQLKTHLPRIFKKAFTGK